MSLRGLPIEKEIYEKVRKIAPELLELLEEFSPEEKALYAVRIEYALGRYPEEVRLRNAYEVMRKYLGLIVIKRRMGTLAVLRRDSD